MIKNPCLSCDHHLAGGSKDDERCLECREVKEYEKKIADPDYNEIPTEKETAKMEETKVCRKCDKEYPIKIFDKSAKSSDGHMNICPSCREKKKNIENPVSEKPKTNDQSQKLTLDFSNHKEVLDVLRVDATKHLRTIENQAVWILIESLNGVEGVEGQNQKGG